MTLNWLTYFPSPARGVWHLGPVPIRAYALCIIVGIVAALLIGDRRWRARGGEPGVIYDIALWAVPFGLIGGRLYHLMTDWRTYFGEGGVGWEATVRIWDGGLGIWGAVALGGVGAWIGCRRRGIPLPAFGDAVAPGIVLAQAIGRIGNYFNQELYGRETTLPWGLEIFWREDAAGVRDPHLLDGVSTGELYKIVQPTFLYELLWNLVVFAVLIYADRRFRMGHGRLFALYVAGYCIGRFGIELLRDDAATHIAGIRVNSFTSTFVFIGAVVYILLATKGREDPDVIRRAWEQQGSGQQAVTEPEPEAEEELVAVGTANGVGSVVRVPKRLTGEGETDEDQDADEGADEADDVDDATAAEPDEDTETPEDAEDVEHVDDAAVVEDDDVAADDAAETDDVVQEADDATAADESDDATEAEDPEPEAEGSEEGEDPEALADPDEESEDAEPEPEVAADEGAETDTEPETSTDEDAEQR
ncbi:prolipoprotein diacylglyceryl transferase [Mycolicibacter sinensis]|jgi:prolipoprotein diacylglyceryl transferase|uniref:Phosphatidylglycerol--prolipoprotein diacylglyceryl transferase n=1 Tax=Mycolicibacter sinensis (strain JDM601) TaxID=875328 RepID=A0A1A2EK24_MYCSD|nr:prolipoprotein diacylglyceryl transferase [Mycolicibacter sinensis]OBG04385.1 prolipoprotein diacylglyceryl transferase [Mycolicibacter sinensis]OBG06723.1 prolipoprotein diacylglyceryl transferase [Mycolicibacter sinensis]